jgi:hypothetical protein
MSHRPFIAAAFAFLVALMPLRAGAAVEHVIAISVDGLRGDLLEKFLEETPQDFPNFIRLRDSGAATFNARCDYWYSETVPNHVCMVTGRPVLEPIPGGGSRHGYTSNFPLPTDTIHGGSTPPSPANYKASVFDVVHDHGLSTALYLGKTRLGIIPRSYDAINGAPDAVGEDNGRAKIDFLRMQDGLTTTLVSALTSRIAVEPFEEFSFFHITDPDTAGHASGWIGDDGPYRNSIKTVDAYLGLLFAALDARSSSAGEVAIVLTADHGGGGGGLTTDHSNAQVRENYTIPFFVLAPGVEPGSDTYALLEDRVDPGIERIAYTGTRQPIRNGDLANVSLALLGLPPVPGSYMRPEFAKPLTIVAEQGERSVRWPRYLNSWQLEASTDLARAAWQPISSGIIERGGSYAFAIDASERRWFFRLRRR